MRPIQATSASYALRSTTFTAGAGNSPCWGLWRTTVPPSFWSYGVTQRESYGAVFRTQQQILDVIRDKLLEHSDRRVFAARTFTHRAILFKTPSTAPKSVLFDAMNE